MKISDRLRSGVWPLIGIAMLMATPMLMATSVSAQDNAVCPAEHRIKRPLFLGKKKTMVAVYRMVLGMLGGHMTLLRYAQDGNFCTAEEVSIDGVSAPSRLRADSNFCCGTDDVSQGVTFEIVTQSTSYVCGNSTHVLDPLNYNGYSLSVYLGDGSDSYFGGTGTDHVYGGSGGDFLFDPAGTRDGMFGEHSADSLFCSPGDQTLCDGGAGGDRVDGRPASNSDGLVGGSGADTIYACQPQYINCGSNIDTAYTLSTTPTDLLCDVISPCQ